MKAIKQTENTIQGIEITSNNKASTLMRMAAKNKAEIQIEGLFERGAIGMIVAPAKAKKTMLATVIPPFLASNASRGLVNCLSLGFKPHRSCA
jgi:hypothetical protein